MGGKVVDYNPIKESLKFLKEIVTQTNLLGKASYQQGKMLKEILLMYQILQIQQQELSELKWKLDNAANIYKDGSTAEILALLKKLMVIYTPFPL